MGHIQYALNIDIDDFVDAGTALLGELAAVSPGGVVDQHIDPSETVAHLADKGVALRIVAHIDKVRFELAITLKLLLRGAQRCRIPGAESNLLTFFQKSLGGDESDPARAAG